MKKLKETALKLWKDESGQGMVEYILLVVALVAALVIFRDRISGAITGQMDRVDNDLNSF